MAMAGQNQTDEAVLHKAIRISQKHSGSGGTAFGTLLVLVRRSQLF